jgi:hypothetical protein
LNLETLDHNNKMEIINIIRSWIEKEINQGASIYSLKRNYNKKFNFQSLLKGIEYLKSDLFDDEI